MNIVILTGAGISAESGIQTFRGNDGLWENHRVEQVATPEAYHANPNLVLSFYNARRHALLNTGIEPNAAHKAIARLQQSRHNVTLITQNVDNLHERGGSPSVVHMHGELLKQVCTRCSDVTLIDCDQTLFDACACCSAVGTLRPDIVWFGEMPKYMDEIYTVLDRAELFVAIGTSGRVYPAAGFVEVANAAGAHTLEINLEASDVAPAFAEHRIGPASERVVEWVNELLSE